MLDKRKHLLIKNFMLIIKLDNNEEIGIITVNGSKEMESPEVSIGEMYRRWLQKYTFSEKETDHLTILRIHIQKQSRRKQLKTLNHI